MKARCYNCNHKEYQAYGKRGIKVCKQWRISIEKFAEDMGPRPSPDHILARRNKRRKCHPCLWQTPHVRRKRASAEIEKQIRDAALEFKQVKYVLELATMYIGSQNLLLQLDIEVSRSTTAKELGEIVEVLKERIKEKVPIVSTIQIEVAPAPVPEA